MSPTPAQTRIVEPAFAHLMQGARLDSYLENGTDLALEVQGLQTNASELFKQNGRIVEKATCVHVPLKLNFIHFTPLKRSDFFTSLAGHPLDDPSRIIFYMHSWQQPGMEDVFYIFKLSEPVGASMNFLAKDVTFEKENGGIPFTIERDWSPAPPMPEGWVPQYTDLYPRFGGDPVTIKVDGTLEEQKLFVGGMENQPDHRPTELDAVLNIGEQPSFWVKGDELPSTDRRVEKGEGTQGMSVDEIRTEANWVIERLQRKESVLVHCVAGMNRSATICIATLMLLEGLSAEEALKRVREHHPWAKPDSYHWLALRWLEKNR